MKTKLTMKEVFASDSIMGVNASLGLRMDQIMCIVDAVEETQAIIPSPAAPVLDGMVMVEALRKARKTLDEVDATACCDHWANMNSSGRRYAIARDARAAVQDIDRVLLATPASPSAPAVARNVTQQEDAMLRSAARRGSKIIRPAVVERLTEGDTLVLRLRGRAKYLRDVGEHKSAQLLDEAAQRISPAWFCPRCKVDRFKEDCPNRIGCPMVGETHGIGIKGSADHD